MSCRPVPTAGMHRHAVSYREWTADVPKSWMSDILSECVLLTWIEPWLGPRSLKPMGHGEAQEHPHIPLVQVWMLRVWAEKMSTIAFSTPALHIGSWKAAPLQDLLNQG